MAVAPVKKIQLLAHRTVKADLLTALQEGGLIHIDKIDLDENGLKAPAADVSSFDHDLYRVGHAIEFLSRWGESGLAAWLSARKPEVPVKERMQALAYGYREVLDNVEALESEQQELFAQLRVLEKDIEFLTPFQNLDLPVKSIVSSYKTDVQLGAIPTPQLAVLEEISETHALFYEVIRSDKRSSTIFLITLKADSKAIEPLFKEISFNPIYFTEQILKRTGSRDRVEDVIAHIRRDIEEKRGEIEELEEAGKRLSRETAPLMRVYDVLLSERTKKNSLRLLGETDRVLCLEGWIRSADIDRLQRILSPYVEAVEYQLRDPLPEEEYPVALENRRVWRPFELITKLYGLPQQGTLDPTVSLAPFFFVFVGLTVSEAGYGALVAVLSLLFLKIAKPRSGLRQFLILLTILGVANIIIGTLVGGWFGYPLRRLLLLDPLQDPVRFLMLALVLGFIQVWFGTLLNLISHLKNKEYAQAIFVKGGWLVLLPGLALYFISKHPLAGIAALAGCAGIVFFTSPSRNPLARFFGGLYGLYGISGYLSDILSYSRLLALGLATSVIAMVVNTLCQTASGIPGVGWLLAALIFIGGHLFNLGISFLGGFVHSMRLQFVEFFSKFFKSGGKPFRPLELENKYAEFT